MTAVVETTDTDTDARAAADRVYARERKLRIQGLHAEIRAVHHRCASELAAADTRVEDAKTALFEVLATTTDEAALADAFTAYWLAFRVHTFRCELAVRTAEAVQDRLQAAIDAATYPAQTESQDQP